MKRDLNKLERDTYDVAVVGGGILGAFISLIAARRGMAVVLVEKHDFGSGTTAGSGKVIHGGIRYLQSLQFCLAKEAQHQQSLLASMAPDLVRPLPFLVPSRRGQLRENLVLRAGAFSWQAFTSLTPGGAELPATRYVDESEARSLAGELGAEITGGMLFHDLQLRSPERLTFEIVRSAAREGAHVANYCEMTDLHCADGTVRAIDVWDHHDNRGFEVETASVVNATGAWAPDIVDAGWGRLPDIALAKGIHLVLDRPEPPAALALPFRGQEGDNPSAGNERRIFVMPWEGGTLVGASYAPFEGRPDQAGVTHEEVSLFVEQVDRRWPSLGLGDSSVLYAYSGLYPVFGQQQIAAGRFAASKHPLIVNHSDVGGPEGLLSVVSVKFTTAAALAERIVGMLLSAEGTMSRGFDAHTLSSADCTASIPTSFDEHASRQNLPALAHRAAREEMATGLPDVLFRRTWIGHLGHPGRARLREAARSMGAPLGWSEDEEERQVRRIDESYEVIGARTEGGWQGGY